MPINDVASSAQLSMGRLRSKMPSSTKQLQPKMVNPAIVQTRLKQKQAQQKSTMIHHQNTWNIYLKVMMFMFSVRENGNLLLSQVKQTLQGVSIL